MDRRSFLAASLAGTASLALPFETRASEDVFLFRIPVYPGERFRAVETHTGPGRISLSYEGPMMDRASKLAPAYKQRWAETKNPALRVRILDRSGSPWLGASPETFAVWDAEGGGSVENALYHAVMFWPNEMCHRRAYAGTFWENYHTPPSELRDEAFDLSMHTARVTEVGHPDEIAAFYLEVFSESDEVAALREEQRQLGKVLRTVYAKDEEALHERLNELGRLIYRKRHGLA